MEDQAVEKIEAAISEAVGVIREHVSGTSQVVGSLVVVAFIGLILAFMFLHQKPKELTKDEVAAAAQVQLQTAMQNNATTQQKNAYDLQTQVVKACMSKGGIPAYQAGNVECRKWEGK